MQCIHGVDYPSEGPNGLWNCEPDGANPRCPNCSPDTWTVKPIADRVGVELRPEVRKFAELMEMKLRANDHKGGWKWEENGEPKQCDPWWLLGKVCEETAELEKALGYCEKWHNKPNIEWLGKEAADVANFAMMIADVCGALKEEPHS